MRTAPLLALLVVTGCGTQRQLRTMSTLRRADVAGFARFAMHIEEALADAPVVVVSDASSTF